MANDTQSRKWMLTINNPVNHGITHDVLKQTFEQMRSLKYWCMADEIGLEDGTHHIHIFLYGSSSRFSTIKNKFPAAHIEMGHGSIQQCRDYVNKSGKWAIDPKVETKIPGTFEESGEAPVEAQGQRNDLTVLYDMIKQGLSTHEILESNPTYINQLKSIDLVRQINLESRYAETIRDLEVVYVWGDPGTGKTSGVYKKHGFKDVFRISDYKYPFDGYSGQDIIVFDEFNGQLDITLMNKLLEGYPFQLPSRYNNKWACYTKVYIIANSPLGSQFKSIRGDNELLWLAFARRINKILHYSDGKITTSSVQVFKDGWRSTIEGIDENPESIFGG